MSAARRLLFVSNSARGEFTGRFRWLHGLREAGYEPALAVPHGEPWHVDAMRKAGLDVHLYEVDRKSVDPLRDLASAVELAGILRKVRPALAHSFGHKANLHTALATRFTRRPAVVQHVTGLGSVFTAERPTRRQRILRSVLEMTYRASASRTGRILFENADDASLFPFLRRNKWSLQCASGVDTEHFDRALIPTGTRADLRRDLGLRDPGLVVTFVGRLLVEKGIEELLEAAESLARDDVTFLIVGSLDPGNPSSLDAAALDHHQRATGIRFLGRREDVRELLAVSSVFVNPSYREGLPRTNLEASSMGVPVVTTDVPGCRDTVAPGVGGLLVPVRDPRALRDALATLLDDADLRRRLGRTGREFVTQRFSLEGVVQSLDHTYREILR